MQNDRYVKPAFVSIPVAGCMSSLTASDPWG